MDPHTHRGTTRGGMVGADKGSPEKRCGMWSQQWTDVWITREDDTERTLHAQVDKLQAQMNILTKELAAVQQHLVVFADHGEDWALRLRKLVARKAGTRWPLLAEDLEYERDKYGEDKWENGEWHKKLRELLAQEPFSDVLFTVEDWESLDSLSEARNDCGMGGSQD